MVSRKKYETMQVLKLAKESVSHYKDALEKLHECSVKYDSDCLFEIERTNLFIKTWTLQSVTTDIDKILDDINCLVRTLEEEEAYLLQNDSLDDNELDYIRAEAASSAINKIKECKKQIDVSQKLVYVNTFFEFGTIIVNQRIKQIKEYYKDLLDDLTKSLGLELSEFCEEVKDDFKYNSLYLLSLNAKSKQRRSI